VINGQRVNQLGAEIRSKIYGASTIEGHIRYSSPNPSGSEKRKGLAKRWNVSCAETKRRWVARKLENNRARLAKVNDGTMKPTGGKGSPEEHQTTSEVVGIGEEAVPDRDKSIGEKLIIPGLGEVFGDHEHT